mgnify:CR=1 FL=1
MENNKKSFILHLDSLCILDDMTLEQKGILFDAIYKYQLGIEVDLDFGMKMAFSHFKNQFIRDNEKYIQFSKKQSENGKKGGMVSEIVEHKPASFVSIRHYGFLDGDTEITTGEQVEQWAGGHENYSFEENNGITTVIVVSFTISISVTVPISIPAYRTLFPGCNPFTFTKTAFKRDVLPNIFCLFPTK